MTLFHYLSALLDSGRDAVLDVVRARVSTGVSVSVVNDRNVAVINLSGQVRSLYDEARGQLCMRLHAQV